MTITTLLAPATIQNLQGLDSVDDVNPAFSKVQNVFVGIIAGLIGAWCYNKFKDTKLPDALSFFSGKRSVAIVTAGLSLVVAVILMFVWPVVYTGLVTFGEWISTLGPFGAGLYGFFNRLLIPTGLHHALNSVFWFDVAGINDLVNFLAGSNGAGVYGVTGQYMAGFFPVMMFGLPGAALAMYLTAKTTRKKVTYGIMLSAAVASFFVGVTEPLEFSFMFLAPWLYLIHAVFTAISVGVAAWLRSERAVREGCHGRPHLGPDGPDRGSPGRRRPARGRHRRRWRRHRDHDGDADAGPPPAGRGHGRRAGRRARRDVRTGDDGPGARDRPRRGHRGGARRRHRGIRLPDRSRDRARARRRHRAADPHRHRHRRDEGQGFETLVKTGDHVEAGTPLIRFDPAKIRAAGLSPITPVIVLNDENATVAFS